MHSLRTLPTRSFSTCTRCLSRATSASGSSSTLSYPTGKTHPTPFEIFSLPHTSQLPDAKELKRRYYALARKYHPDVCTKPGDHEKFSHIKAAYELLTDAQKFEGYLRSGRGWKDADAPPHRPKYGGMWGDAKRGGPMKPHHMRGRYPSGAYDGGFKFDSEGFRQKMGESREQWKERGEKGWILFLMCLGIGGLYAAQFFKVGEIHKMVNSPPPSSGTMERRRRMALDVQELAAPSPGSSATPSSTLLPSTTEGTPEVSEKSVAQKIFNLSWLQYLNPAAYHRNAMDQRHREAAMNLAEARERARSSEGNQNEIVLLYKMKKISEGKEGTGH